MSTAFRQIHLDFHTSPLIPDVGSEFDAAQFAATLKQAKVQSINLFAKCHHGVSYYPSKIGPMHPSLQFDMLGQMIEALHAEGILCPVYTTVVWDEAAAHAHPEWIQLDEHGKQVGREPYTSEGTGWSWLCVNNLYEDYLSAQVDEILKYKPDGLWFDINQYHISGCSCARCIDAMQQKGYDPACEADRVKHSVEVIRAHMKRLSAQVWASQPNAEVFFNGRQRIDERKWHSLRRELDYISRIEIESLPSGPWGYNHFPIFVRYNKMFNKPIIGMNGRFHKSWADFGGMKNRAALEFECFYMMACGAMVCIGDQLHPRGRLDEGVYALIGEVFTEVERKQPWCEDAKMQAEIGLMCVNDGTFGRAQRPHIKALEAAAQVLLEHGDQFDIIDWEQPLDGYKLVIFPDKVRFDEERARIVKRYIDEGGKVILTGWSGTRPDADEFALDLGFSSAGPSAFSSTYLRVGGALGKGLLRTDYVSYERGLNIVADRAEVLAQVVEPYFERAWNHFMSHQQTAPDKLSKYAGAVRSGDVIYFSDPLFGAYKTHGNHAYKLLIQNAIELLLGRRMLESDLPSTARVTVCDQPGRRVAHLLHYPVERRADIDIIEDVIPLYDRKVELMLDFVPSKAYLAPSMERVPFTFEHGVAKCVVREIVGHQMLVFEK